MMLRVQRLSVAALSPTLEAAAAAAEEGGRTAGMGSLRQRRRMSGDKNSNKLAPLPRSKRAAAGAVTRARRRRSCGTSTGDTSTSRRFCTTTP